MSMPFCALSCVIDGLTAASVMSKRETPNTGASIRSPLRTKAGLRIVWRFFFPQRVFVAVLSYEKFTHDVRAVHSAAEKSIATTPPPSTAHHRLDKHGTLSSPLALGLAKSDRGANASHRHRLTHDALVRGGTRHNPSVVLPDAMKRGRPPVPDLLGAARQPSNAIDMCQCETGVLQGGTSHR